MEAAGFSGGRIGKIQIDDGVSPGIFIAKRPWKFWGGRRFAVGERSEGLENLGRRGLSKKLIGVGNLSV